MICNLQMYVHQFAHLKVYEFYFLFLLQPSFNLIKPIMLTHFVFFQRWYATSMTFTSNLK